MKKLLCVAILAVSGIASAAPFSYPGNTWGTIVYTGSKVNSGEPHLQVQGIVEQGVDWLRFGDSWKLNSFVALEYVIDSNARTFTPVIGTKVNKRFSNGSLDLGIRVKNRNQTIGITDAGAPVSGRHATVQLYSTFWFDWNLKK